VRIAARLRFFEQAAFFYNCFTFVTVHPIRHNTLQLAELAKIFQNA